MIVEDQLDRGTPRISGIEKSEEFDQLAASVAVSDKGVDLAGEQINPGQQAERAVAFVFMVARKAGVDARLGWQIGRRRCDGLDSRLLVAGDNRYRLCPPLSLDRGFLQDLDYHDRRTGPPPSSVRTRRRGFQDSSAPCAA